MNDDLFSWDTTPETTFVAKAPYAHCGDCPLRDAMFTPTAVPTEFIRLIAVSDSPLHIEHAKLLDAVLTHTGIEPNEVYHTSAVLCKCADVSKHPTAIVACQDRLQHEIAAITTNDIVALGAVAVGALDSLSGHTTKDVFLKRRGNWYGKDKKYLATLHPKDVLRNTGYIGSFLQDIRSITAEYPKRNWLETPYKMITKDNRQRFIHLLGGWLEEKQLVSFDVETVNTDYRSPFLALGLAVNEHSAVIVPAELIKADDQLKAVLVAFFDRARLVAQNGKFDQKVLAYNGLGTFNLEADTMLEHYMLDENKGTHGLKQLLTTFLGVPDYEAEFIDAHFRGTKRENRDYSTIPRDHLYQYLAIDVCGTLALHNILAPIVAADDLREAPQIAINASNALQHTEMLGIKIDRPYLLQVLNALNLEITKAEIAIQSEASVLATKYLYNMPSTTWYHLDKISWIKSIDQYRIVLEKIADKINLNSWQQVQVLLYDVLGLTHTKKLGFKTDARSTNQEALEALEDHPFILVLRNYRRLAKIKGTYVEKLLALADENDRVHITFNIHGTETGRLSANDGLHGIPRPSDIWGRAIRGSFIAQDGYTFVIADYSQAELRCFAAESKEPFLLNAYNNDEDVHGNTCKALFPDNPVVAGAHYDQSTGKWKWDEVTPEIEDTWKELRTIAKNTNFGGLVYLGGASGVAAMIRSGMGMDITEEQLKPILAALLNNIPTARQWQHAQFRKARDQGFVQSRFGNKRRFMLITPETLDDVKKASVNAPIQNSASQLTLLSGIELTRKGIRVVHYNHDQLMCEVPLIMAERVEAMVKETMERIGNKYFPEVKWKADVDVSLRWYDKRPIFEESE